MFDLQHRDDTRVLIRRHWQLGIDIAYQQSLDLD